MIVKRFSETKKKEKGKTNRNIVAGNAAALGYVGAAIGLHAYNNDSKVGDLRHKRAVEVSKNKIVQGIRDKLGPYVKSSQKKQFDEAIGAALNRTANRAKRYNRQLNGKKLKFIGTGAAIGTAIGSGVGALEVNHIKKSREKAAETRRKNKLARQQEKTYSSPTSVKVAEPYITKQPVQGKKGVADWVADKIRWKKVKDGANSYEIHRGEKAEKAARIIHSKIRKGENFVKSPKGKALLAGTAIAGTTAAGVYAYKKHKNKKANEKKD